MQAASAGSLHNLNPELLAAQQVRDRDAGDSLFREEGGSNFLSAERFAAVTGESSTGKPADEIWGPPVHGGAQRAEGGLASGGFHAQDERQSIWKTEGGSNVLCGARDEALRKGGASSGGGSASGGGAGGAERR